MFYNQCQIQLIEALAWLDISNPFEYYIVQKFFNREFSGQVICSENV